MISVPTKPFGGREFSFFDTLMPMINAESLALIPSNTSLEAWGVRPLILTFEMWGLEDQNLKGILVRKGI